MPSPLTKKLGRGVDLNASDEARLDRLMGSKAVLGAREAVVQEGDRCESIHILVSGWACRFKTQAGVGRQIVGFLVPGDHVCGEPLLAREMDYGVCTLTRCEVAELSIGEFEDLVRDHPTVGRGLRWADLVGEAILREWVLGLGRRPAEKRMAHLFCELLARLQVVGLADHHTFSLPLTQATLGDALGLSPAHVNRSLQNLRARGMVVFENGGVELASVERLQKFASFNPRYLHLGSADALGSSSGD